MEQTKSDVMALCNVVVANNKISGKVITMIFVKESSVTTGNPTDIMTVASNLLSTKKYTIESLAISAEGYVQQIKITEQP